MSTTTPNTQFAQICAELTALHERKNHDYGNAFENRFRKLAQHGKIHALNYLLSHTGEKQERAEALVFDTNQVENEHLEDSLADMASYCIMGLAILRALK